MNVRMTTNITAECFICAPYRSAIRKAQQIAEDVLQCTKKRRPVKPSVRCREIVAIQWLGCSTLLCVSVASAQPVTCEGLGGVVSYAFHADTVSADRRVSYGPAAGVDVEVFFELIGMTNTAQINALRLVFCRATGLNNASARMYKDFRYITFDPNWVLTRTPAVYLVLGHEAGHHFCEHTVGKSRTNPWDTELEADRFAGAAIRRLEVYHSRQFMREVLTAASSLYTETGSVSHPPRPLRLQAIAMGYDQGSSCGGLAPGTRSPFGSIR
jgi:hypothetical protein